MKKATKIRICYGMLLIVFFILPLSIARADSYCEGSNASGSLVNKPLNSDGTCPSGSVLVNPGGTPGSTTPSTPASAPTTNIIGVATPKPLTYTPLEPLPGIDYSNGNVNLSALVNGMFKLLLGLGAMIAVVTIVIFGITYMTSVVPGTKAGAQKRIEGALFGLLILLCTWIILNTINPALVKPQIQITPVTQVAGTVSNLSDNIAANTCADSNGDGGSTICVGGNNNAITAPTASNVLACAVGGSLLGPVNAAYAAAKCQFVDPILGAHQQSNQDETYCTSTIGGTTNLNEPCANIPIQSGKYQGTYSICRNILTVNWNGSVGDGGACLSNQ